MTSTLVIRSERSVVPILTLAITAPLALLTLLPTSHVTLASLSPAASLLIFPMLSWWANYVRCSRVVEIDVATDEIRVQLRTLALQRRTLTYRAADFVAVTSYLTHGSFALNYLELLTRDRRALLLASFQPGSAKSRFWTLLAPAEIESAGAKTMRQAIMARLRVSDTGFLGHQVRTERL